MKKEPKLESSALSTVMVHGFYEERFNSFLGRMLTLVETLGLPQGQETAFKSLVKQEVWDLWEHAPFMEEKDSMFYK